MDRPIKYSVLGFPELSSMRFEHNEAAYVRSTSQVMLINYKIYDISTVDYCNNGLLIIENTNTRKKK